MFDFDYISRDSTLSVVGIVYIFASDLSVQYRNNDTSLSITRRWIIIEKNEDVDPMVNFASSREMLQFKQIQYTTVIPDADLDQKEKRDNGSSHFFNIC